METVVAVEEGEGKKQESGSAIQIADPVVYKLARVVGDGRYIPATDDEVMKAEDLIDHKSELHYVLGDSQTAVCTSNDDTFGQEFMAIDCELEDLLKFDDPSTQGEISDAVVDTRVDLGKLNPQFEEITRSESTPIDQSGDVKQADHVAGSAESEPSISTICASWKPDFSKLKGEICLDDLSVKELHATFKATFGRETSVKDKQWLKRRISMGLSNSCDASVTTFNIENNEVKKKDKSEECINQDENHNKDSFSGDDKISVGQSQTIQMEDHFSGSNKNVQSDAAPQRHIAFEDDNQGNKRVRKPTRRYIEEVSESDSRDYSGRTVSSVRSSGNGPRTRVRPVHNIQPVRRPLVTRQDSLGGSGVKVPYVSRIRRGRPRENFMALMKFQPHGMGMSARLVKKAQDGHDPQSDNDVENQELKATPATGWPLQPLIKEPRENEQYSEQSADIDTNSDEGHLDSYADVDSDENILTVPTAKGGMRRKHHRPWTLSEVVKLVEGVSRHGAGRWSEIKRIAFATCSHRTSVDLKDKWRNLLRASFAQLPADKGVQNSKKHSSIPIPAPILLRVRELAEMQSQVSPDLKAVKFDGHSSRNVNDIRSGFL
ncbi:putative transcription factor MYB-HB-like family [Helianthus annuus]|uniref:Putative TRF-like 3 n=1 Tax=Helianthus annuus TaxID=4232 RepID=A0A251TPX2_HELAN|nr:uncharacterized protein LOC110886445 isoform X1 [Helianthus annuus]KAF5787962.1 putative transcription factor MYB-related family [Helianthus annuus]KAJ0515095.1 putative transcription factor MYB-HB-like family [Helianthus annuus]KAJ0531281.1 putative transcription factor MYB-HB-like family [Helianthus annuus]KAJ0701489.1 putative transcription factor MYB-HB-like family [Helianthus annuus]KAJ0881188.1 putative transcription factor MYB-HB-like family [Helianthus annuus]